MVILSVDYGRVRTGVAVCDRNEIIASPVEVIKETDMSVLAEKISYTDTINALRELIL